MTEKRNRITKFKREELTSILNNIYAIVSGKNVDVDSLDTNVKGIVKPFVKAGSKKRFYMIEDLFDDIKELVDLDDIKSLAGDINQYIKDIFYREPLKKFNYENLEDRLYDLDEMSEENNEHLETKLIELLRNLNEYTSNEALNINSYPAIVVGLAKTYDGLNDQKRIEFLEMLNEYYDNKYSSELNAIASEIKKRQIENILAKVKNLSIKGQMNFYEEAYDEVVEIYGRIAKEERIKQCNHEMGKWKDCSYTTYINTRIDLQMCENVPVEKTLYVRKCKKCGYEETLDSIPNEVKIEREEKARQQEIRRLEKRLKKLKDE